MFKYLTIRPIWKKLFWFIVWCLTQILTPIWNCFLVYSDHTHLYFYFEEFFYIFIFFFGFVFLLIKLLSCELIWPTQSFNKRHGYFSNNVTQHSFLETFLKLNIYSNNFVSFEFIFFFTYHLNCEITPIGYELSWW